MPYLRKQVIQENCRFSGSPFSRDKFFKQLWVEEFTRSSKTIQQFSWISCLAAPEWRCDHFLVELTHEVSRVWDFGFYLNTASTEQQLERGLFEAVSSQIIKKQQVPQLVVLFDWLYIT